MNPYEILQLQPGASMEDIKAAYNRLAKQWHPDRYSDADRPRAEQVYEQLNMAFGMLKASAAAPEAPAARPTATQGFAPPTSGGPSIGLAPTQARQDLNGDAARAFENGQYEKAKELIQAPLEADPENYDLHALHAKILDVLNQDKRALVQALEHCLRLNKKDIDAAIRLAQIYQGMDMHMRATRYWEWAHSLNPQHPFFAEKPLSSKEKALETVEELGGQVKGLFLGAKNLFGKR